MLLAENDSYFRPELSAQLPRKISSFNRQQFITHVEEDLDLSLDPRAAVFPRQGNSAHVFLYGNHAFKIHKPASVEQDERDRLTSFQRQPLILRALEEENIRVKTPKLGRVGKTTFGMERIHGRLLYETPGFWFGRLYNNNFIAGDDFVNSMAQFVIDFDAIMSTRSIIPKATKQEKAPSFPYVDMPRLVSPLLSVWNVLEGTVCGERAGNPSRFLHGDLYPSNILIGHHGEVQVIDFGHAHFGDPHRCFGRFLPLYGSEFVARLIARINTLDPLWRLDFRQAMAHSCSILHERAREARSPRKKLGVYVRARQIEAYVKKVAL